MATFYSAAASLQFVSQLTGQVVAQASSGRLVLLPAAQGLPGIAGPAGESAGTTTLTGPNLAPYTIQAGQPVMLSGSGLVLAQADSRDHQAIGLASNQATAGALLTAIVQGPLELSDWTSPSGGSVTLATGSSYYLAGGAPGIASTIPTLFPEGAICQFLGRALSATRFLVQIERPIIL